MKFWIKHKIGICLAFALLGQSTASYAENITFPRRYLSHDQSFLENVYAAPTLFRFQYGRWKKNPEQPTQWILDVPEFTYAGKKEPIRFVATQATKYPGEWLLYALQSDDGKWVGRYARIPIAKTKVNAAGNWDGSLLEHPNLTILNLPATLKTLKITYNDDREYRIEQLAQMCTSKVDNNVNNRRLVQDIFNVEKANRTFTEWEYKLYLNNPYYTTQLVDLTKRAAKNSLYGSIYGAMAFMEAFERIWPKEYWEKYFTTQEYGLKEATLENTIYKKAKKEMIDAFDSGKGYQQINLSKAVPEFNSHITRINSMCLKTQREYQKDPDSVGATYFPDKEDSYAVKKMAMEQNQKKWTAQRNYQRLADLGAEESLKVLREQSELAALWQSKFFENQVGHFDAKKCAMNGDQLGYVSYDTVEEAVQEIKEENIKAINQNSEVALHGGYVDTLKTYALSSPYAVRKAIMDKKSVNDAGIACAAIREIYNDDQFDLYLDRTLMVGGLAAGMTVGALTGTGALAPAVAPYIIGAVDAIFIARGSYQWYNGYFLDQNIRRAIGAQQISGESAQRELSIAQSQKNTGMATVGLTIGGNVVGYGIGKGIQAYKSSTSRPPAAITQPKVEVVPIQNTAPREIKNAEAPMLTVKNHVQHTPPHRTAQYEAQPSQSTALVPVLSVADKNHLATIETMLQTSKIDHRSWENISVTYHSRDNFIIQHRVNVISYDPIQKRILVGGMSHQYDYHWMDVHDVIIREVSASPDKFKPHFFETNGLASSGSFRTSFLMQELKKGDLISFGHGNVGIVQGQLGNTVIVETKVNGKTVMRKLSKDELEKSILQRDVIDVADSIINDAAQKDHLITIYSKQLDTFDKKIDLQVQELLDELAYYEEHLRFKIRRKCQLKLWKESEILMHLKQISTLHGSMILTLLDLKTPILN